MLFWNAIVFKFPNAAPLLDRVFGGKSLSCHIALRSISGFASSCAHLKGDPFNCRLAPAVGKGPEPRIAFLNAEYGDVLSSRTQERPLLKKALFELRVIKERDHARRPPPFSYVLCSS